MYVWIVEVSGGVAYQITRLGRYDLGTGGHGTWPACLLSVSNGEPELRVQLRLRETNPNCGTGLGVPGAGALPLPTALYLVLPQL